MSCACSSCGSAFRDTAPEEPEAEQPLPPKQALPPRVQPNSIIQCPRALREDSSSCLSDDRREVWYGGGSESGIREARGERREATRYGRICASGEESNHRDGVWGGRKEARIDYHSGSMRTGRLAIGRYLGLSKNSKCTLYYSQVCSPRTRRLR